MRGEGVGLDTALAQHLDAAGALPRDVLLAALATVRSERPLDDLSLSVHLVARGLLEPRVVEAHLTALATRAGSQVTPPPSWASESSVRESPYELLGELGRGGMGVVFEVRHKSTGQRYALKQLLLTDAPELRARFAREAQLLARLEHPGLIRVHSAELEGPTPHFVLEFFSGGSLMERLRREGPLPLPEALRITREVGAALSYLHQEGVLHRDLKPQNVLFGGEGEVRLADFGLARAQGSLTLTQAGELLGTPAFMPPEQAVDGHSADARSDVYALGALLYTMLSGAPPFQAASPLATLDQVLNLPAPALELPGLPLSVAETCAAALAKDPAERPASVAAFLEALEATSPRARARARRPVVLVGLILLGLGGWAGARLWINAGPARPDSASPSPLGQLWQPWGSEGAWERERLQALGRRYRVLAQSQRDAPLRELLLPGSQTGLKGSRRERRAALWQGALQTRSPRAPAARALARDLIADASQRPAGEALALSLLVAGDPEARALLSECYRLDARPELKAALGALELSPAALARLRERQETLAAEAAQAQANPGPDPLSREFAGLRAQRVIRLAARDSSWWAEQLRAGTEHSPLGSPQTWGEQGAQLYADGAGDANRPPARLCAAALRGHVVALGFLARRSLRAQSLSDREARNRWAFAVATAAWDSRLLGEPASVSKDRWRSLYRVCATNAYFKGIAAITFLSAHEGFGARPGRGARLEQANQRLPRDPAEAWAWLEQLRRVTAEAERSGDASGLQSLLP